jgi:hypothetical protein
MILAYTYIVIVLETGCDNSAKGGKAKFQKKEKFAKHLILARCGKKDDIGLAKITHMDCVSKQ